MTRKNYKSWGFATSLKQVALTPRWLEDVDDELKRPAIMGHTRLAFGNGRSYGDSCLNSKGQLIDTQALDRFIAFDVDRGELTVEPGITLANLLKVVIPKGWFLPVTPGTSYVTVGGAIANDVHGKNHHRDGTFGRFVSELTLSRSSGEVLQCSPDQNSELFSATIGGLGLTGFITRATIRLIPIRSTNLDVTYRLFNGIEQFLELAQQFNASAQYTVAWIDCASSGKHFARGVFMAANHANDGEFDDVKLQPKIAIPFAMPSWVLNKHSIKLFNKLYYKKHEKLDGKTVSQPLKTFFYPLDALAQWNRIYGGNGFHQYQFVVPKKAIPEFEVLLEKIVKSGMGSFLAVLKEFGDVPSPGMLSFPREGLCLALDFADRGRKTEALIKSLDEIVRSVGGAAYPAKDRLMTSESFQQYFSESDRFSHSVDPSFSSDFWRRVMPSDRNAEG